ncbi:MAG: TSUP family transporter [Daejeonella sp.]|uniref:TSUP family transporter n=1 Tax=Daejeonella sp. TaxID=2805397 RepID=UPI002734608A|nr:TSUP family transporter [Daejeonella sp.]MDP3467759.1 TSUP family transporter [Daejeonella sp.]
MSFQSKNSIEVKEEGNQLFPVFLKLNQLKVLLVGGGNIGLEKLQAVLLNSPEAKINIVSDTFLPALLDFVAAYPEVKLFHRRFEPNDLLGHDLVILATGDNHINAEIRTMARGLNLLINVADKPELCDFYLGSIVKKGDLKIGISTNGKSPTIAKRLKELFQENLPDELDLSLQQMNALRNTLNGDFAHKVKELNKATAILVTPASEQVASRRMRWALWGTGFFSLLLIFGLFWFNDPAFRTYVEGIHPTFYYFLIAGFIFAMIDGAIGMSYGVTSTTFSLSMGIPPASASTAVHVSEILSNGIAGWMHFRMKNVNMRLFWMLLIPGVIGAVLGAVLLSSLEHYSYITKPIVSLYTLILGIVILLKAIKINQKKRKSKIKNIRFLGFGGGFIDAVGGGGWGSIVLSSLIAGGRNARYALGTVKLSRFFIALMSSLAFITMLNNVYWEAVLGLVIGSAIASPIAARLSNKISVKAIMIAVSIIVILVSLKTMISTLINFI